MESLSLQEENKIKDIKIFLDIKKRTKLNCN